MWQLLKQSIYVPNAFRKDFFASKTVIKEFLDKHIMCAPFVSGLNLCKFWFLETKLAKMVLNVLKITSELISIGIHSSHGSFEWSND